MREKNTTLRIVSTLLISILMIASVTQAVMRTNTTDQKIIINDRGEKGTRATSIWEDHFNNATKIDPTPPGSGQTDNYVLSNSQVSMVNTYAAWTDPAWTKMKPITLTSTAGQPLSNNVVYLTIAYESGMQSQFQDIRFRHENNPTTWLNYWIEWYNTTVAKVWVKVPTIPVGSSALYLFYGNPSAPSQSNFTGVFSWSANWADDDKTSNHADNQPSWDPDVVSGNNEFIVTWEEGQPWYPPYTWGYKQGIRGSMYDLSGNKLVNNQLIFNDGTTYYRNENPSVDFGGGKFFVAWQHWDTVANPSDDTLDIKARLVQRSGSSFQLGSVIDVCTAVHAQADANVQFDSVNNRFCVAWEDASAGYTDYDVWGRLYDTSGNPIGNPIDLTSGETNSQCEPWLAFDPIHQRYMLTYESGVTADNGPFSIKARIFDKDLTQIGSTITIATGSDSVDYNFPCVEFSNQTQRYLVTWDNDDISTGDWWGNIWGEIFDYSGTIVVSTFEIKSGEYARTDIAPYFSSSFFVSFNSKGTSGSGLIWGKMIASNGNILGGDIQLSASSSALADWANIGVANSKILTSWEDIRITYPSVWDDMPDIYSNLWSSAIAGSSVTYTVGTEKQLVLTAHVTSVKITPSNFSKWDVFNATYIDGTISFDILDGTTGVLLLSGVQQGWNLYSHGIVAATIRLKATFTRSNPSTTPKLDKWSVKWELNQPPNTPSNPSPAEGTTNVSITTDLGWTGGDPNGDPVTYDVYFGTTNPPPKIISNQSGTSYDTGTMSYGTTYYWKIVAWDNHGAFAVGPLWHFTTHNDPPTTPGNPSPANGATGISVNADLSWTGGDPNPGDTVTYDVYFGTASSPPKVSSNQSGTSYDPGTMSILTTYHWKIVAWDNHGASANGALWDFTTTFVPNNPPYVPSNPNPQNGAINVDITTTLSWTGGDPDPGDIVTYDIYFGTFSTPPLVSIGYASTTYDPGTLEYNTMYYWKIVAWDNRGASTPGPLWEFITMPVPNNPPYVPSSPTPVNHASGVSINANLGWTSGDPDSGDTVTYDIYFGSISPPPKIASNQSGNFYDPGTLNYQTTYYWKIVAWDNHGASSAGPIWDFTTENEVNTPPYLPSDPFPANHATNVALTADLSWNGGDPDPGDTVTYDVYFGVTTPPPKVMGNQSSMTYDPGTLNYLTTYYWKIVAWDNHGASTTGSLWDFTTIPEPNSPPYTPNTPIPANGSIDVWGIGLSWSGGDPDSGDTVTYDVYFGTSSSPPKIVSNQSGTSYDPGTLNHLTTYYWKIVAWDNHGASAIGPLWHFTTIAQELPPYTPNTPIPANGATGVSITTDLSWLGGDPDPGDTVTYDVYFGTSSSPPKVMSNQTGLLYHPGTLLYNMQYYWKIVAWDNHEMSATGPVWHFTTIAQSNNPPNTPNTPTPANGAANVPVTTDLSWLGGDPDSGDIVTYDIYFGTTSPPPLLVNNHTSTSYHPATLQGNTTYYWRIIAWDNHDASAAGAEWRFTTEILGDTTPPSVQITKPEKAIYLRNNKILPFIITVAIRAIDVEVTATDTQSGVARVEFYVDGILKANDTTAPYTWTWSKRGFFIYTLRVIAYDTVGNHAKAELKVLKFF